VEYYQKRAAAKSEKRVDEPKAPQLPPRRARVWSEEIRLMGIELQPTVTVERWTGGLATELADWIVFCEKNGGGARLKFAQAEQKRLMRLKLGGPVWLL
jgi:hypothetical protein